MAIAKRKLEKSDLDRLRLDKWLWAARFFKTRKLAGEAIAGGKVHVNKARVKPAKIVVCDDEVDITRGGEVFHVIVTGLNDKRRPASEARLLYEESPESIQKREEVRELRKMTNAAVHSEGRPDKRQRRQLRRFKEGGG